jgi:hypothetical protein
MVSKETTQKYVSVYVFKLFEYGSVWAATLFTEKLFSNNYMNQVYTQNKTAPTLYRMLGTFIGLNILFTAVLLTFALLVYLLVNKIWKDSYKSIAESSIIKTFLEFIKNPSKEIFKLDSYLMLFLIDYLLFLTVMTVVLAILIYYMQKKKFFRYQTEGLRAIRALKELTLTLASVFILIPYFEVANVFMGSSESKTNQPNSTTDCNSQVQNALNEQKTKLEFELEAKKQQAISQKEKENLENQINMLSGFIKDYQSQVGLKASPTPNPTAISIANQQQLTPNSQPTTANP